MVVTHKGRRGKVIQV
ncbi:hypothetical protein BsWGS_27482 [Bradybaena similaris]